MKLWLPIPGEHEFVCGPTTFRPETVFYLEPRVSRYVLRGARFP